MISFLKDGALSMDKFEAEKIRRKAPQYWLSKEYKLYKKLFLGPYLLCVHSKAVEPLFEEVHEGISGSHTRGRSLSHRALIEGH